MDDQTPADLPAAPIATEPEPDDFCADPAAVAAFIARWREASGSERANYQLFLTELCALLGLPQPEPARADNAENAYCLTGGEERELAWSETFGVVNADLTIGADLPSAALLVANAGLCSPGVQLYGAGFIIDAETAAALRSHAQSEAAKYVIKPYLNGRDFMATSRNAWVIDFFGLEMTEARSLHPEAFQRVLDYVKPERDANRRPSIRDKWWRFGWERPVWRKAVAGLSRFISTPEVAKHRVFVFLGEDILPDNRLTNFALHDGFHLGVLSSHVHVSWALAAGGTLEDRPVYNKTTCFDRFPFPDPPDP